MGYVPVVAGKFDARKSLVDGHWLTTIEGPHQDPYGSIARRHLPGSTRKRPKSDGVIFAAQVMTWFLPQGGFHPSKTTPILDTSSAVYAHIEHQGSRRKLIHLPGDSLMWERHSMSPAYRIEGGYIAARTATHQMVPGFSNRPFAGTIGPRIAGRPDGALALLLAAWFTAEAIERKVEAANEAGQPL